jgi:hypothetical protein
MKVHVVVTDSAGKIFEGDAVLVAVSGAARARRTSNRKAERPTREALDFSLPVRAFMKRHARRLGGPQKFTALLARLTMGKVGVAKSLKEINNAWNRMTEPMGGRFNPAYTTRAKDNGWVDTPKIGFYALRPDWASALGKK